MTILSQLRRFVRREFRQEFANHHLGFIRKRINALRNLDDHRKRRSYVRALTLKDDCLQETSEILDSCCARVSFDERTVLPFLRICQERFNSTDVSDEMSQEGKNYYLNLLREEDYDPRSIYMQFALNKELLNSVAMYLGQAAYLQSIELILSRPKKREAPLTKSQLWHCDNNNDQRLLKLFLYVTDVTDANGPLTFIPRTLSEKIPWHAGHYVTDDLVERYVPLGEQIQFMGPAGSALIMDTASLYHFGSRCEEPRLTFVAHYNSGFGYLPRNSIHQDWASDRSELSAVQRFALGQSA